jgi:hypothetical protein
VAAPASVASACADRMRNAARSLAATIRSCTVSVGRERSHGNSRAENQQEITILSGLGGFFAPLKQAVFSVEAKGPICCGGRKGD